MASRLHEQQFPRAAVQKVRIKEIRVFRDHHPLLINGKLIDRAVFAGVSGRQIQRVRRVMPMLRQHRAQAARQVGVHHKLHFSAR